MRTKIINLIRENLIEIIPELEKNEISPDESFVNLGANSVDRGELITLTIERLNLPLSRVELAGAQTINELADLITEKEAIK
jgi:polyketide biosynthesis acyl carrier protein